MRLNFVIPTVMAVLAVSAASSSSSEDRVAELRNQMYKQIDFSKQQFFDKAGNIRDEVFSTWSDSQLKAWADAHDLKVPQTSNKDKLEQFARKNKKLLKEDIDEYTTRAASEAKPFLDKAAEQVAQASDNLAQAGKDAFDSSVEYWTDSRLKAFLDARGVHIGPRTKKEKLIELVRENKQKAIKNVEGSWTFDSWATEDLRSWLKEQGKKADGQRQELINTASDYLNRAKDAGSDHYDSVRQSLQNRVDQAKISGFEKWSDSDLKAYLDTYGVRTYQGSTRNELLAHARAQYGFFTRGADPQGWTRIKDSFITGGYQLLGLIKGHGTSFYHSAKDKANDLYKSYGQKQSPLKFQS